MMSAKHSAWAVACFATLALAFSISAARPAIRTITSLTAGQFQICETPDLDPDEIISYCAAMIKMNIGISSDGIRYPRRANLANYTLHTGLAFQRKGQEEFAQKYFAFAIGVITQKLAPFPNDPGLLGERCWVRAAVNSELDAALNDCERALAAKPDDAELLRNKGFVLLRQEKNQYAMTALNASLQRNPNDPYALYLRGLAKQRLGDFGVEADFEAAAVSIVKITAVFKNFGLGPK